MATYTTTDLAGFPNASNTGPKGTLKPSGSITISTPGAVISGLDIKGTVTITAPNVTLMNCKISGSGWAVINVQASGAIIKDNEIDGQGAEGIRGISGGGTFLRNNIHDTEDGIYLTGKYASGTVIQDNYIHDLQSNWSGPHYDGIATDGGVSDIQIRHNTVINDHGQTSALMLSNYFGSVSNVIVDNNYLAGGGYTIYADGQFSGGSISGVQITNNYVGKGQYGYYSIQKNSPIMSGNFEGSVLQVPDGALEPSPVPEPIPNPDPTPTPDPDPVPSPTPDSTHTYLGTSGDDKLVGTSGADKLTGLAGNDVYRVNNTGDVIVESYRKGTDKVESSISYILTDNVENLQLMGSATINGTGNSLNNKIIGNDVANTLKGAGGNDTLNGWGGKDVLYGGSGKDIFQFSSQHSANGDKVMDFAHLLDKLDFRAIDVSASRAGDQGFIFDGYMGGNGASSGHLRAAEDVSAGVTHIYGNVGGTAFVVDLKGVQLGLTASDFYL